MTERIEPGTIIKASWGYDQTNVDWYICTKRTPVFAWLQRLRAKTTDDARAMTGTSEPDPESASGRPFRRKVYTYDGFHGECVGINTYTTGRIWNGKPAHTTGYA